jgi:hypothetical protein
VNSLKVQEPLKGDSYDFCDAIKSERFGVYFSVLNFGEGTPSFEATFEIYPVLTISPRPANLCDICAELFTESFLGLSFLVHMTMLTGLKVLMIPGRKGICSHRTYFRTTRMPIGVSRSGVQNDRYRKPPCIGVVLAVLTLGSNILYCTVR